MNGPKTKPNGEIVRKQERPEANLVGLLNRMHGEIKRALPAHLTAERLVRIAITALRTTPDLALCTEASFVGCVMQLAQLGLEPNTPLGHAWLIPRKSKALAPTQRNCTAIIGYQGQLDLVRRSGQVGPVIAYAVRPGDLFDYELGLDPILRHKPSGDPDRENDATHPIAAAYAVAKLRDSSDKLFTVLSRAQIEKRRLAGASAYTSTPWDTHYEAMALKSAVRELWRWLPKSAEMARAEALDIAAENGDSQMSALDPELAEALVKSGAIDDAELIPQQAQQPAAESLEDQLRRSVQGNAAEPRVDTTEGT